MTYYVITKETEISDGFRTEILGVIFELKQAHDYVDKLNYKEKDQRIVYYVEETQAITKLSETLE